MPLTRVRTLGITDGAIVAADIADGTITAAKLASGVGGKVLQVVQTTKTDTFTSTSTSFTDVTGLSVSITPSSASNKILVLAQISYGGSINTYGAAKLIRGSTSILEGNTDSANRVEATIPLSSINEPNSTASKSHTAVINYLDSPATTSSTTYKIQIYTSSGAETITINRTDADNNQVYTIRAT